MKVLVAPLKRFFEKLISCLVAAISEKIDNRAVDQLVDFYSVRS